MAVAAKLQHITENRFESKADLSTFCSQARELVQLPNLDFPGVLLQGMDLTSAAGMLKGVKLPAPTGPAFEKAVDTAMQARGVDSAAVTAAMQSRGIDLDSVYLEEADDDKDESPEEEEEEEQEEEEEEEQEPEEQEEEEPEEPEEQEQEVENQAEEEDEDEDEDDEDKEDGDEGGEEGSEEESSEASNKMGFSKILDMLTKKLDPAMLMETLQDFVAKLPDAIQVVAGAGMKLLALKSQLDKVRRDSMIAIKEAKKEKQRRASAISAGSITSPTPADLESGTPTGNAGAMRVVEISRAPMVPSVQTGPVGTSSAHASITFEIPDQQRISSRNLSETDSLLGPLPPRRNGSSLGPFEPSPRSANPTSPGAGSMPATPNQVNSKGRRLSTELEYQATQELTEEAAEEEVFELEEEQLVQERPPPSKPLGQRVKEGVKSVTYENWLGIFFCVCLCVSLCLVAAMANSSDCGCSCAAR
eukprot:3031530-Rhodomonas_salina.5